MKREVRIFNIDLGWAIVEYKTVNILPDFVSVGITMRKTKEEIRCRLFLFDGDFD